MSGTRTTTRRSWTIAGGLVGGLVAALLLAGCSTTSQGSADAAVDGSGSGPVAVAEGAPAVGAPMEGGVPGVDTAVPSTATERQVIRTGYLTMRAEDVAATTMRIRSLITGTGGLISSEDAQSNDQSTYSTITAQIPADRLDTFVADVSKLGTVDAITISAQDVTTQVVDLDARISALQTSITRLTQLLAKAERIEDLLAIETQLSQRQADLDALTSQRDYLKEQVAMSTITVSVSPLTAVTEVDAPGFWSGLQSGWSALVSVVMVGVTAIGFLLPFLVILLVVVIPLVIVLVRQARRRSAGGAATDYPNRQAVTVPEEPPTTDTVNRSGR